MHDDSSRFRYSTGYVFVSSSDALSFYICSQLKAEKSNFLNDFFLSLLLRA